MVKYCVLEELFSFGKIKAIIYIELPKGKKASKIKDIFSCYKDNKALAIVDDLPKSSIEKNEFHDVLYELIKRNYGSVKFKYIIVDRKKDEIVEAGLIDIKNNVIRVNDIDEKTIKNMLDLIKYCTESIVSESTEPGKWEKRLSTLGTISGAVGGFRLPVDEDPFKIEVGDGKYISIAPAIGAIGGSITGSIFGRAVDRYLEKRKKSKKSKK